MAEWTFPVDTEHNIYPNFTVKQRLRDGVLKGYRVVPNEGYVFYDTTEEHFELDPETMIETPVIHYYTEMDFPITYNWGNFSLVAVLRSTVDENYIFGLPENEHEVM